MLWFDTFKASPSRLPTPLEKKEYSINIFSLFVLSFPSYVNQPVLKDLLLFFLHAIGKIFHCNPKQNTKHFFHFFPIRSLQVTLTAPEITLMPISLFMCYILPRSAAVLDVPFPVISLESLVNSLFICCYFYHKSR